MNRFICLVIAALVFASVLSSCSYISHTEDIPDISDEHFDVGDGDEDNESKKSKAFSYESVPAYSGSAYVAVNGGEPYFTDEEKKNKESFESYGELDTLGRCTAAFACVGKSLMPTGKRDNISSVKPTAWHSDKYEFIDGRNV